MTKDRCKCKCVQQSHGNYCVSNPSVQYEGMIRASGNVGVYDVVTFNISADVEKCWEGTGNQATLDAGGYNGVFVNLSGSNLGPNAEPKTTTPILPLTGIALSDELATNDSSQDQTRYSRQISYIFTGVEVDAAVPHNQAYAVDWQLNAGSGTNEPPSWWNPEDGKQIGVPPCSKYGRVVSIYEVPQGSSSGIKDTVIPLATAGATDTNSVVVYERAVLNQSSYPDQPGRVSAAEMGTGVAPATLLNPQPSGYAEFPEALQIVAGAAFDGGTNTINEDDVVTLTKTAGSLVNTVYYAENPSESDVISATNRLVLQVLREDKPTGPYTTAPFAYIELHAQPNGVAKFYRNNGPLLADKIYNFKELLDNNYAAGGPKLASVGDWSNFTISNSSLTQYGSNIFKSLIGVPTP